MLNGRLITRDANSFNEGVVSATDVILARLSELEWDGLDNVDVREELLLLVRRLDEVRFETN